MKLFPPLKRHVKLIILIAAIQKHHTNTQSHTTVAYHMMRYDLTQQINCNWSRKDFSHPFLQAHLLHGWRDLRRAFAFAGHEVDLVLAFLASLALALTVVGTDRNWICLNHQGRKKKNTNPYSKWWFISGTVNKQIIKKKDREKKRSFIRLMYSSKLVWLSPLLEDQKRTKRFNSSWRSSHMFLQWLFSFLGLGSVKTCKWKL